MRRGLIRGPSRIAIVMTSCRKSRISSGFGQRGHRIRLEPPSSRPGIRLQVPVDPPSALVTPHHREPDRVVLASKP